VAKLNMSLNNKTKESIQNFEYINLYTYVHICIYRLVERICANRERERERERERDNNKTKESIQNFEYINIYTYVHICTYR
jgi:hypothetical protein